MKVNLLFIAFFGMMLSMISCKSEPKLEKDLLVNNWEVVGATREGRATETINGAYFHFTDETLETNFMGKVETHVYEMRNRILQIGDPMIPYRIQYLDADSMHLSTTIMKFSFDFFLHPKNEAVQ